MKKLLFTALLASLLPLGSALADNLIYLGSETNKRISSVFAGKVPSSVFLAYDRTNARLGGVLFFGTGKFKRYIVLPVEDVTAAVVGNKNKPGQTLTAIARAETTDFQSATVVAAALLKGVNVPTDIGGTAGEVSVPKTLSGSGFLLDTGDDEFAPQVEEVKTTTRLQLSLTRESNKANAGAGEPLSSENPATPGAIQRIIKLLEDQGYSDFNSAP